MTVEIFVPSQTHAFREVSLVDVESEVGRVTLLERHVDCAASLLPGLIRLRDGDGDHYLGADGGTLVKIGSTVLISTPRAIIGRALGEIHAALGERRREKLAQAKEAQKALARLEVELARSVFEREADGR